MGDFPLMTDNGTFIINGAERVIVSQLVRSPGVYYAERSTPAARRSSTATMIPNRGAWLEFESDANDVLYVRVDRTRKLAATVLLRALGYGTDQEIIDVRRRLGVHPPHPGEGRHGVRGRGPDRDVQAAAARRAARGRQRAPAAGDALLRAEALRPAARRPVPAEQEAGPQAPRIVGTSPWTGWSTPRPARSWPRPACRSTSGWPRRSTRPASTRVTVRPRRRAVVRVVSNGQPDIEGQDHRAAGHRRRRSTTWSASSRAWAASTTSTTWATAACAPSASCCRTSSASAWPAWSGWSRSA